MKAALAALLLLDGCSAQCDARCYDSIVVDAQLTQSPDALVGATITLCVNSSCTMGMIKAGTLSFDLAGAFPGSAVLMSEGNGSVIDVGTTGGNGSHHDGDVLTLHIVDSSGGDVLLFSQPVTYKTSEVCGTSCSNLDLSVTQ